MRYKKSAREISRGRFSISAEPSFRSRFRRRRGGCFLVSINWSRPAQYDSTYHHAVTNSRVINGRWHIWSNGRPTYDPAFRVYNGCVSRVVITHRCHVRRRSKCDVIRIRRVGHDSSSGAGRRLLSCSCACHRIGRSCGRCGFLRERDSHRCRARHSSCQ